MSSPWSRSFPCTTHPVYVDREKKMIWVSDMYMTMLDIHREVCDQCDMMVGQDDLLDITDEQPTTRITDNLFLVTHGWGLHIPDVQQLNASVTFENGDDKQAPKTISSYHPLGAVK